MIKLSTYTKPSIIIVIVVILMLTMIGCDVDNPSNFSDAFSIKQMQNGRRERLLQKLLIEQKKTNEILLRIEERLEK